MKLERIKDRNHPHLSRLIELYKESFPEVERRDINELQDWIEEKENMYFNAVINEGELAGLFCFWNFETFAYMEHLAIFSKMRNHKIGEKVLDYIDKNIKVPHILEVEPPEDELSERRINYYLRNNYLIADKEYIQPSYINKGENAAPLWIMTKPLIGDNALLQEYIGLIKKEAYKQ